MEDVIGVTIRSEYNVAARTVEIGERHTKRRSSSVNTAPENFFWEFRLLYFFNSLFPFYGPSNISYYNPHLDSSIRVQSYEKKYYPPNFSASKQNFVQNVWSIQKNVVILHLLFKKALHNIANLRNNSAGTRIESFFCATKGFLDEG